MYKSVDLVEVGVGEGACIECKWELFPSVNHLCCCVAWMHCVPSLSSPVHSRPSFTTVTCTTWPGTSSQREELMVCAWVCYEVCCHGSHVPSPPAVGEVTLNLDNMMAQKRTAVSQLTSGIATLFKQNKARHNTLSELSSVTHTHTHKHTSALQALETACTTSALQLPLRSPSWSRSMEKRCVCPLLCSMCWGSVDCNLFQMYYM